MIFLFSEGSLTAIASFGIFANVEEAIVVVGMFLIFIVAPVVFFLVNAVRSVTASTKTITTPRANSVDASLSREQRHLRLPSISPPQNIVLSHGELKSDQLGASGFGGVLDAFERSVIRSPDDAIGLAKLKTTDLERNSFLIIYRATPTVHFFGWLAGKQTGSTWQWKIKAAEVRLMRSPSESNSHFNYDSGHDQALFNVMFKKKDDESGLGAVWDLATGNVMTDATAKKAEWFRGYLFHRLDEALTECLKAALAPAIGSAHENPTEPTAESADISL